MCVCVHMHVCWLELSVYSAHGIVILGLRIVTTILTIVCVFVAKELHCQHRMEAGKSQEI